MAGAGTAGTAVAEVGHLVAKRGVQSRHSATGHESHAHAARNGAHPFVAMASAFARALEQCANSGVASQHFTFGGRLARVRLLGDALARELVRPFAHLRTAQNGASAAALSIDLS